MYTLSLSDYTITEKGEIINNRSGRILKPQPNGKGYLRVHIGGENHFVHRLVAERYIPNPENKPQINHKDGNKLNNCVENLEWVTNQENRDHAIKNGLHICGEKCRWAKLTQKQVDYIRANKSLNFTQLAKMFNVSRATIRDIITYRTWKYNS